MANDEFLDLTAYIKSRNDKPIKWSLSGEEFEIPRRISSLRMHEFNTWYREYLEKIDRITEAQERGEKPEFALPTGPEGDPKWQFLRYAMPEAVYERFLSACKSQGIDDDAVDHLSMYIWEEAAGRPLSQRNDSVGLQNPIGLNGKESSSNEELASITSRSENTSTSSTASSSRKGRQKVEKN